jgi:glycerol-3-phosphate O-acyltransferase
VDTSSPIFRFNNSRDAMVGEVVSRVLATTADPTFALNDACYNEIRRLGDHGGAELDRWQRLAGRLGRISPSEARTELEEVASHHARDVAGNFDPRVYKFASKAIAPLLGALLSPRSLVRNLPGSLDLTALDGRILVEGPLATLRKLATLGTIVHVPTHLSNMDSVVFGFALERAGLPPATYGAGKNLFTNPVLSYFMHNLGAYRVDRRLKHVLYKDVLKAYSCVLIENGYHSLFFPGGTRSRSGGVERRLKLGLAGTGIEAFARTAAQGRARKVFFVPSTINYLLTLEAETLIDDFLSEAGKARYIIDDDESTRIGRMASFVDKLYGLDGGCVIRFGEPVDCFGNTVDEDGVSYDGRGRPVDPVGYVTGRGGKIGPDAGRDAEYTRELGEVICKSYLSNTVILPTHIVAAAAFEELRNAVGHGDLFVWLRHKDEVAIPRAQLAATVERLLGKLREEAAAGRIQLGPNVAGKDGASLIATALRAFSGYHTQEVLVPRGEDLVLRDTRLLFYYQNRLAAHGLAFDGLAKK